MLQDNDFCKGPNCDCYVLTRLILGKKSDGEKFDLTVPDKKYGMLAAIWYAGCKNAAGAAEKW